MSIYPFSALDARGSEFQLSGCEGKVVLIVNTASRCGYTPQYAGLQQLYNELHEQGLEILAFPCDQFGHQEPGSDEEIQQFCQLNYGVTFPVLSKIEVNGPNAHPLYQALTRLKPAPNGSSDIQWNFTKFLVDRKGEVVQRFEPGVKPEELSVTIGKLLSNS